jgi:hypothetical protein
MRFGEVYFLLPVLITFVCAEPFTNPRRIDKNSIRSHFDFLSYAAAAKRLLWLGKNVSLMGKS